MSRDDLIDADAAIESVLSTATREDLIKALKAASLIVAEHDRLHGTIPLEHVQKVMAEGAVDDEMGALLIRGYEYLAGILGRTMESRAKSEGSVIH